MVNKKIAKAIFEIAKTKINLQNSQVVKKFLFIPFALFASLFIAIPPRNGVGLFFALLVLFMNLYCIFTSYKAIKSDLAYIKFWKDIITKEISKTQNTTNYE